LLNKEVKVILDLVRMKVDAAQSKIVSIVIATLISGLLVSIPTPAFAAECISTSTAVGSDTVLTFNDVGTCEWTVPAGVTSVRVLVVGGGGSASAGINNIYWPAGGGGGAVVANSSISVTAGNKVTIAVGAGGSATAATSGATGNNGGSSSFGATTASGGSTNSNVATANAGRIGGTSGNGNIGGTGTSSGSSCATGSCGTGGGGGAGGAGGVVTGVTDARNGGAGVNSDISGSTVGYGGGGAGSDGSSGSASHGGAVGYFVSTSASATGNGVANRGGGGARATNGYGGAGGSGVVVVRFATPTPECSPDSVTVGTQTVVSFTDLGTCNWTVPTGVTSVRVLVVGGGGSGGGGISGSWFGAGGGGGAVVDNQSFAVTAGAAISVTVGAGGIKSNYSTTYTGSNFDLRSGSSSAFGSITAGGGKTAINSTPAGGVSGNGRAGGTGAGGTWGNGGAGAAATGNAQNPGAGVTSDISGSSLEYGGGGNGNNGGSTGTARNGAGSRDVAALANRGGGGSQMPSDSYNGSAGGSGVVIVRYAIPAGFSALSFDSNGGTGSKNSIFASTGSSATVPDATGFTNQGFEFNGWNSLANGSGQSYAAGSSLTLSANTTLFAQWTRLPAPSCAAGVGKGGPGTSNFNTTKAGNGCVGISYKVSGVTTVATFNYTGTDQSWTAPTGVTSATFYLIGAGGGGGIQAGGGGGYATGTYSSLTSGQVLTIIVGQGGGGVASATRPGVSGYPGQYTPTTYGGGGRGGSYGGATANWFASGGGRSAIRLANATEIATAAGGGGGAYGQCGFGGGGTSGLPSTASGNSGTGGTQTAGGTGGISNNGYPGTVGAAFQGGDSRDEGGGGGGGYFGGGGGGDNAGGPGGSSYIALLSNALTTSGGNCGAAALTTGLVYVVSYNANTATSGSAPSNSTVSVGGGTLTLASNTGNLAKTNYTFAGWNTAANGSGTNYAVGATTFIPSGDTTLYAQWNSTITYNGNGQTTNSSTVPGATTAIGGTNTTLANAGTMARTNFTFAGWNTQADGLGTNYASGLTTYTSTGNTTLYARWTATITYDPNGASGSPATSSSNSAPRTSDQIVNTLSPIALSNLPTVGTMVRPGFTFGGWNTAANGSGTNFSPNFSVTDPLNPRPYMRFKASDFNDATNAWADSSGNNRNIPGTPVTSTAGNIRGNPTVVDASGNGTTATFKAVKGDGSGSEPDGIVIGNEALTNFTFCHVARYSGSAKGRIFAGVTGNWLSGYWGGSAGVAHPENWITSSSGTNDTNWRVMCHTGGTTSGFRSNGVDRTTATNNTTGLPANITINLQGSRTAPADQTDWEVAEFVIYSGILNTFQIETVENSLKTTYGISGYTSPTTPATAGSFTPTGNTTLYARWLANGYTLTFDTSTVTSGSMPDQWFSGGTAFTLPANAFSKPGSTFKGWNTAANGSGTAFTNSQSVTFTSSVTLYPQWTLLAPGVPTVSVSAGNTEVTVTPTAASTSSTVGPPSSMLVTAYTNAGAALSPAKTCTVVSPATSCVITGLTNGTAYKFAATATNATSTSASSAQVSGTPAGVIVTFDATSNSGAMGSATVTNRALTSNVATITTFAPHGLTAGMTVVIASVATPFNGTFVIATVPSTTTFTYALTATNVSATTSTGTATLSTTATFNKGTALVLPSASRSGYVFSGWYTTQSSGGSLIGAAGANYSPTTAITLYARFSGIVYTINYNGNGNTGGTVPSTGSYETGSDGTYNNTQVYTYTGADQTFTVPNDITGTKEILVEIWGAGGGGTVAYYGLDYGGGAGGYTKTTISTATSGEVLTLKVGKGGTVKTTTSAYGGAGVGGNTSGLEGSSGGGYSGVFAGSTPLAISGGGGGASPGHNDQGIAGGGGGANQSGTASTSTTAGGRGGTTSAGGAKAADCAGNGSQYLGGNGCGGGAEAGGGGGGGYYGGGGGNSNGQSNGGGGGGSGYLDATRGSLITATVGQIGALSSTWAFPNKTSSNYGTNNAGRGGKGYTNTTADSGGGDGRIVIQWKTGSGAHVVGAGPTKVGYTFAGWTTNANGTGDTYQPNASLTPSTNVSLFAKWTANTNTITYNANSGTGSVPSSGSYVSGAATPYTVLSKPNDLTKTGSEFIGWNTAANGTGTGYSAGASLTTVDNVILYAQWRESTYSYSYQLNGGTSAQPASGTAIYNASITLPAAPTRTGFTFAGWNDGTNTISLSTTSVDITTNRIFVAQWTAQSFTISFDGDNAFGGVNTSGSVASGTFVAGGVPYSIAANGFTKPGYNFDGWKNAGGTSFVVGSGYSTAANLTLIAQWTPASYTIAYNANGATSGTAPSAGTLTTGTAFTAATNSGTLAKTGYTFSGWNTAASGSGTNYAEGAAVTATSNLTLFAKWTIISPTITFDRGIATSSALPANTSAQYGSLYTIPTSDTSTVISGGNYVFTGWADNSNNVYQPNSTYRMGATNLTFTAQWVAVYTVRYVLNGGLVNGTTGALPSDILRVSGFGETLTATVPIRSGHTFSGWKDQAGVTISATGGGWTISDSSYIAYAQWTQTPRTLSFSANSGTGTQSSITGKFIGELVPLPEQTLTRDGYTFGGWSDGTITYPAGGSFTVGNSDQAFTAVWVGNSNTIFYNGNGATGGAAPSNGSQVTGAAYTVASNASSPNTLVKSGFTFAGWNTNANGTGTDYAEEATGLATTSNVTLFAKWTAASFAVTYVTGVGASAAPTQADTMYGSSFTLPTAPTQTGFNFLGWETGSGVDATLFAPGSSYTMGSSAVTFTAKWSGLSYVVVYLLNGGSGTTPTQPDVTHGQNFTTAPAPTRNGFTFSGWSDGATVINASTSVTNVTSNKTLTAQWAIAAPGIPGTPTAAPGNGSATITIVAPTTGGTPSSYTVTAAPGGATCTVTAPGTSCTIAPLDNGTAYTFTSTATNTAGTSASASAASAAVTPAGVPLSPSSITGTGLGGSTTIEWTAPTSDGGSPITDYVIEYSVAGSGTWTTFSDGTSNATSATITGLTAGNAYEFRVSAKNLIGNSLPSFTSPVVETLSTAPTITSVTGASEKVTVAWNAPSHLGSGTLTDYEVTAYDASGNAAGSCKPASGQRTCEVTGLDNGSSYTFKVAAITSVGTSAQSSASSVVVPAGVPSAPANVVAVTSGSNMTVTFDAPADNGGSAITSYVVTSSPAGATCTRGANATTYTCTGLTAGTNYTYSVKAVNSKGESSASLDSTAVTAVAAPSAPLNVSAVITAGTTTLSATVSFDPPASENGSPVTSYTVTASPGGATCTVTAPTTYCDIPVLPDSLYTFTATATNAVGTSTASVTSLRTAAANGIAPTLVVDPIPAPTGDLEENKVLSSNITFADFNSTPNSVVTYQWKRCTDPLDDTTCTNISGATNATYTLGSSDVDKYIRVEITATNSIGTITKLSDATAIIVAVPTTPSTPSIPSTPSTPSTPAVDPTPVAPTCDSACQAIRDAAATKAAADAAAKAAADKAAADAAAKLKADADARTASNNASAAAKAAADAAKTAVERAGAAAAAKAAADAAAATAAAQAKAAADAQAAANKAAAAAQAALKNSAASAAAKAAATASANKAATDAAAAVKAAATAAQNATKAKTAETNANKQVDIAINSLSSKTASARATAEANAIAAAAKAAANEAAAAASARATEARATAAAAQKAASDAAARIATEQREAATAAAAAKAATEAAARASAEKIAATNAAKVATETLVKVLNEKATLAEAAANATDTKAREEIAKKIEEIETRLDEIEAAVEEAQAAAEEATAEYEEASDAAEEAQEAAAEKAQDAIDIKAEVATKTAAATKATANATVAAKVATAAKAAAAKVPSKAVIAPKPSNSINKNSAKATVTGLKPGQKVKVTVNVKPRP
jgi:uncharacterized repeat protein (TIGR02543 family)